MNHLTCKNPHTVVGHRRKNASKICAIEWDTALILYSFFLQKKKVPWPTALGNNFLSFGNKFLFPFVFPFYFKCVFFLLSLISPYSSGLPLPLFFKGKRVQASLSKQINTIEVKENTNGKKTCSRMMKNCSRRSSAMVITFLTQKVYNIMAFKPAQK